MPTGKVAPTLTAKDRWAIRYYKSAIVASTIAISGLAFAVYQYSQHECQWHREQAIQLVANVPIGRSFIASQCLRAGAAIADQGHYDLLHDRFRLTLTSRNEAEWVRECLADHDSDSDPTTGKMYMEPRGAVPTLTPEGDVELARRINVENNYDAQVAFMARSGIADLSIVKQYFNTRLCHSEFIYLRSLMRAEDRNQQSIIALEDVEAELIRYINENCGWKEKIRVPGNQP